jgi:hypothetical protein
MNQTGRAVLAYSWLCIQAVLIWPRYGTALLAGRYQGSGSGSGLDPDSVTLWIRIRIGNTDPGSASRDKKVKKFQWKMHFLVI